MKSNTLELICGDLLGACVQSYTEVAFAPAVPARTFVTHGPAGSSVWKGEQLTVACAGVKAVQPFPLAKISAVKAALVPGADLTVEVVRSCWPLPSVGAPGSSLPDPADITAAAILLGKDASTIFGYVSGLAASGGLFPSVPEIGTAEEVAVGPMVPLPPQGALAGWRWQVSVKLAIL